MLTKLQGRCSSGWAVVLLFVNVLVQGMFVSVVLSDLTVPNIDDDAVIDFRAWRTNIAHMPCV